MNCDQQLLTLLGQISNLNKCNIVEAFSALKICSNEVEMVAMLKALLKAAHLRNYLSCDEFKACFSFLPIKSQSTPIQNFTSEIIAQLLLKTPIDLMSNFVDTLLKEFNCFDKLVLITLLKELHPFSSPLRHAYRLYIRLQCSPIFLKTNEYITRLVQSQQFIDHSMFEELNRSIQLLTESLKYCCESDSFVPYSRPLTTKFSMKIFTPEFFQTYHILLLHPKFHDSLVSFIVLLCSIPFENQQMYLSTKTWLFDEFNNFAESKSLYSFEIAEKLIENINSIKTVPPQFYNSLLKAGLSLFSSLNTLNFHYVFELLRILHTLQDLTLLDKLNIQKRNYDLMVSQLLPVLCRSLCSMNGILLEELFLNGNLDSLISSLQPILVDILPVSFLNYLGPNNFWTYFFASCLLSKYTEPNSYLDQIIFEMIQTTQPSPLVICGMIVFAKYFVMKRTLQCKNGVMEFIVKIIHHGLTNINYFNLTLELIQECSVHPLVLNYLISKNLTERLIATIHLLENNRLLQKEVVRILCLTLEEDCYKSIILLINQPLQFQVQFVIDLFKNIDELLMVPLYCVVGKMLYENSNFSSASINSYPEHLQLKTIEMFSLIGSSHFYQYVFPINWTVGVDIYVTLIKLAIHLNNPSKFKIIAAVLSNQQFTLGQIQLFVSFLKDQFVKLSIPLIAYNKPKNYPLYLYGVSLYIDLVEDKDLFIIVDSILKQCLKIQPFDANLMDLIAKGISILITHSTCTIDFSIPLEVILNIILDNAFTESLAQTFFVLLEKTIDKKEALHRCSSLLPRKTKMISDFLSLRFVKNPSTFIRSLKLLLTQ